MEELFDICTPEGVPTGQRATRSQAHEQGLWHRSSHLWILNSRGQVLLQRRHLGKQTDPGRWDIAAAGHLSAGQTPLEAIVREAYEELGLVLEPATLSFLGAWKKEYLEPSFLDREWQHVFVGLWEGAASSLVLQPEEVIDARWMDLGEYRRAIEGNSDDYVDRKDDGRLVWTLDPARLCR